jgi:endosialidase-like protein
MKTIAQSILVIIALVCFSVMSVQAVSPTPDGCYPGFTTAEGCKALQNLTSGVGNTGIGWYSLFTNSIGNFSTGLGAGALALNNADNDTAVGAAALLLNSSGTNNTAVGTTALVSNVSGSQNTAIGSSALFNNTTADNNTAIGLTALGNATGQGNIGIGAFGGNNITTGEFNIEIFSPGLSTDDRTIRIGDATHTATYIGGISGATVPGGVAVIVGNDGHLGTIVSSKRFKDEIKPMNTTSEAIFALKPVTFRYKQQIDPKGISNFGLVAEDVEKVNPDLVARDKEGKPYTVRYDQINAMLLNEFLKEHKAFVEEQRKVQEQAATIDQLKRALDVVLQRLDEHDLKIQGVSDQVKMSQARQVVLNQP